MLWLAVCLAIGILIAKIMPVGLLLPIVAAAAFGSVALLFLGRSIATILTYLAFISVGIFVFTAELQSVRADRLKALYDSGAIASGSPVEIEGVLSGRPEATVNGEFITLRAESIGYGTNEIVVSGKARLFVPTLDPGGYEILKGLKYGSRVRIACSLEREDEFLNPGVMTKRRVLDQLGVDVTGSVKSPLLIEHIADESVFLPLGWVYASRANLIDEFRQNLSPKAAGVMIASLLGNKYFLDKDTAELFRDGGTFHILVISGLHITFIGGILLLLMRQITRKRWVQFAVTIVTLWAYALAVGADVPVVRAAIMFTVVLFGYSIYRRGSLLNSLGLCGLILLAWRPSDLFSPSFQLTFVSVAAIVAGAYPVIEHLRKIGRWTPSSAGPFPPNVPIGIRRFCEMLYWDADVWRVEAKRQIWKANVLKSPFWAPRITGAVQRVARSLFEGLLVSLIVQLWMLPLTVVYFHRISVASILLNLWVGVFIAIESFAAVAAVMAGYFSSLLAAGFYAVADAANWLLLLVSRLFSDGGWASFRLPDYTGPGFVVYLIYFLPIVFLAVVVEKWRPFSINGQDPILRPIIIAGTTVVLIALIGVIAFHPFSVTAPDGRLHFDFLDVGQGDAALVTFPDGKTMLVDGGGRFNFKTASARGNEDEEAFEPDVRGIGEAVVSEFLWYRGLSRLDHILATHADADHMQGLTDVAKNFGIGSAIFGRKPMADADFSELAEVLQRRGIPAEMIVRGDRLKFGNATVEVLYPMPADAPNAVSDNDNSVVLRIIYGSRTFLLTGDIERHAEAELLNRGGTLTADVIKVAHHGSRTSSTQEFINATKAKYAIIPVGRSSLFGHPHAEVVERWKAAGATVMTTGERGLISVSTDGKDLKIAAFQP